MPVYVDSMKLKYGRMIMSHMLADTDQELLEMADKIGVQRKWHQCPGTYKSHFDICQKKKKLAIEAGAIEVGWRFAAVFMLRKKEDQHECP